MGPSDKSVFTSREELKNAWERARERMMASLSPGRRPQGYYEFEYPGVRPPYDLERSSLWREGLLTAEEKTALEREWRREFETAQAPDFSVSTGDGILHGELARIAHYQGADIPYELAKRWTAAARRKRGKLAAAPEVPVAAKHDANAP